MSDNITTTVQIKKELHQKIKIMAAQLGMSVSEVVEALIRKGLGILVVCLMFTSCASKQLVPVDQVNMKRFEHDQKARPGMTQAQVMAMFGSPDAAEHTYFAGRGVVKFVYYEKIFCSHKSSRCYFYFDNKSRLVFTANLRMEFSDELVSN